MTTPNDDHCGINPHEIPDPTPEDIARMDQLRRHTDEVVMDYLQHCFNGRLALQQEDMPMAKHWAHEAIHVIGALDRLTALNAITQLGGMMANEIAAKYDWDFEKVRDAVARGENIFACECPAEEHTSIVEMEKWLND